MKDGGKRRGVSFSGRIPSDLRANAIARLRRRLGTVPHDLTISNPTQCGLGYPAALLGPLAERRGLVYRPDPLGLPEAREAVAAEQRRLGRQVAADAVVLTTSTSEAYSLLFKLLADAGHAVLVPAPSYPLFEPLARLDGLATRPYPLDPLAGWQPEIDPALLADARALVVVHPNNPTGSYVEPDRARDLAASCASAGVALIADEVFLDYPLAPGTCARSFAGTSDVLTFTLGGLSKHVGLPQLKLAWTIVSGPAAEVARAIERLEFIADHYLSVAAPTQLALATLLEAGAAVREAILARCRANLDAARDALPRTPAVEPVWPAGGWTLVLRYPHVVDEETLVLELLEQDGVAVHPGYFFDFDAPGYLALSLLTEPATFARGLALLLDRIVRRL